MKTKNIHEKIGVIADWYGVHIPADKMELICVELDLIARTHFDTMDREDVINFVTQDVVGMRWPRFGDSEDYKDEFARKFKEKAQSKGYALDSDWSI